jgi:hypothetical protein
MEIDQAKAEEQEDGEAPEPVTPDRSDDETDAEDAASVPQRRGGSSDTVRSASVAQDAEPEATESKGVPPPRALPFGRPATRSRDAEKKPSPPLADDDDETDDEEL